MRTRQERERHVHFCLFLNKKAGRFNNAAVTNLIDAIRAKRGKFTVIEPKSSMELHRLARQAAGLQKRSHIIANATTRRGPVTALVACGGDGTFNLVARAALESKLPVGILPMGRSNDIALSVMGSTDSTEAIKHILSGKTKQIDSAVASDQLFFGSVGIGLIPNLANLLIDRKSPSLGIGWSKLGSQGAAEISPVDSIIKVDAFRFEVPPLLFNVNLLPYSLGLPISPASIPDDGVGEIIFDHGDQLGSFGQYLRLIHKKKYIYGDGIRLYRGTTITMQPVLGRTLYLDGELLKMPNNVLEILIGPSKLQVLC